MAAIHPDHEVSCAFKFLFDSSYELKKIIAHNYNEEMNYFINEHEKSSNVKVNAVRSCSFERTDTEGRRESACRLIHDIETNHKCLLSNSNEYDIKCIEGLIYANFKHEIINKLLMGLHTGGMHGFSVSLHSFCKGQSAFITFTVLDVGTYFQNTHRLNMSNAATLKIAQNLSSTPMPTKTTNQPKNLRPLNDSVTATTSKPASPKPTMAPSSLPHKSTVPQPTRTFHIPEQYRKQYIIESIIAYFLRAAEKRLQCSIKPVTI